MSIFKKDKKSGGNYLSGKEVRAIAKETEVDKIAIGAFRNLVFWAGYYILYVIALLPFPFAKAYTTYFSAPVLLLYLACIILNLYLIFSCYARICDSEDVEMERKPSRFAFVNRMRAESEERRRLKEARYAEQERLRRQRKKERRGK